MSERIKNNNKITHTTYKRHQVGSNTHRYIHTRVFTYSHMHYCVICVSTQIRATARRFISEYDEATTTKRTQKSFLHEQKEEEEAAANDDDDDEILRVGSIEFIQREMKLFRLSDGRLISTITFLAACRCFFLLRI